MKLLDSVFRLSLMLLIVVLSFNAMAEGLGVTPEITKAVLVEDWKKVASLLDKVDTKTPSPVLRMIKGHADLALNRNNESFSIFVQLTFDDVDKWSSWTNEFSSNNGDTCAALYFSGDALARGGSLGEAHSKFTKAVDIDKNCYLAWNARGVISTLRKEYDNSMKDFNKALSIKHDFIDVNNNIAMMRINQGQGRRGAIKRFRSVINKAPKFALAYHGLGCLELLKAQKLAPEENKNIQKALELLPDAKEVLIANEARFANAFLDKQARVLVANAGDEGTTIERTYEYKKARLDGAIKQVAIAQDLVTKSKSNFFLKGPAEQRLRQAQQTVVALSSPSQMKREDWAKMVSQSPKTVVQARNIVGKYADYTGNLTNQAKRGSQSMGNQSKALGAGKWAASGYGIVTKNPYVAAFNFAAGTVKGITDHNKKGYDKSATSGQNITHAVNNVKNYIPIVQFSKKQPLSSYKAPIIPTTSRNMPGIRDRFNSPGGGPGAGPGGATTNKADVTWDDNKWPFMPIFGLLYFGPQTNS